MIDKSGRPIRFEMPKGDSNDLTIFQKRGTKTEPQTGNSFWNRKSKVGEGLVRRVGKEGLWELVRFWGGSGVVGWV